MGGKIVKKFLRGLSGFIAFASIMGCFILNAAAWVGKNEGRAHYSIYQLDLENIDTYIILHFYGEEAFTVYSDLKLCKRTQVQNIYSYMVENLKGDESEEEIFVLFEKITFQEALKSIANGAPAGQLIVDAPETLKALGADIEAYNSLSDEEKKAVEEQLTGKSFSDLESFVNALNKVIKNGNSDHIVLYKTRFNDINDELIAEAVEYLAEAKIISGRTETMFFPDDGITRAEFAKLLVLSLGIYDEDTKAEFIDVSVDDWYYSYVASAADQELILGYGDTFGPNDYITLQDVMRIIHRVMVSKGLSVEEQEVQETLATRGQVAKLIYQLLKTLEEVQ
jgi:hypothetical protein